MSMTAASRSTTMPPSRPCAPSRSAARTYRGSETQDLLGSVQLVHCHCNPPAAPPVSPIRQMPSHCPSYAGRFTQRNGDHIRSRPLQPLDAKPTLTLFLCCTLTVSMDFNRMAEAGYRKYMRHHIYQGDVALTRHVLAPCALPRHR
jgi:hypothetical protein